MIFRGLGRLQNLENHCDEKSVVKFNLYLLCLHVPTKWQVQSQWPISLKTGKSDIKSLKLRYHWLFALPGNHHTGQLNKNTLPQSAGDVSTSVSTQHTAKQRVEPLEFWCRRRLHPRFLEDSQEIWIYIRFTSSKCLLTKPLWRDPNDKLRVPWSFFFQPILVQQPLLESALEWNMSHRVIPGNALWFSFLVDSSFIVIPLYWKTSLKNIPSLPVIRSLIVMTPRLSSRSTAGSRGNKDGSCCWVATGENLPQKKSGKSWNGRNMQKAMLLMLPENLCNSVLEVHSRGKGVYGNGTSKIL